MYSTLLSLSLVAIVSAAPRDSPAQPGITPAPKAEINDGGGGLFGWYEWSDEWYSTNCPSGQEYGTYSSFGACCSKGGKYCTYATGCSGNNVLYIDGGVANCGEDQCDTATVFDYKGSPETNVHSAVLCFPTSAFREVPRTFYRDPLPTYSSFLGPGTSRQIVFGSTIAASDSGPTLPQQSPTSTGESTAAGGSTAADSGVPSTSTQTNAQTSAPGGSASESPAASTTSGSAGGATATGGSAQPSKSNAAAGTGVGGEGRVWGVFGVLAFIMLY